MKLDFIENVRPGQVRQYLDWEEIYFFITDIGNMGYECHYYVFNIKGNKIDERILKKYLETKKKEEIKEFLEVYYGNNTTNFRSYTKIVGFIGINYFEGKPFKLRKANDDFKENDVVYYKNSSDFKDTCIGIVQDTVDKEYNLLCQKEIQSKPYKYIWGNIKAKKEELQHLGSNGNGTIGINWEMINNKIENHITNDEEDE